MTTPDYDPNVITPPPGPGTVVDLAGSQPPLYSPPPAGGSQPQLNLGNAPAPSAPKDVALPSVPDFNLKDVEYKQPQLPAMPAADNSMTPVPRTNTPPMADLLPGGDTTALNEDWRNIAGMAPGVTADQTVQGQLQKLFEEGSPLLEYARGIGQQYANSRGLINSDIAAEAGAMALYNQAVPIATADAQIFARRAEQEAAFWQNAGLQAQAANFQSRLQAQAHVESMREQALQGDINARLQLQQFGYNWNLNEQQNIHRMELSAFEGRVQARLNLQQLGLDVERLRVDWGYRVQANDQELRNALVMSKFEDDQLVQRLTQQHTNTLQQIGYQSYQQQLADYYNNQEAFRRQTEAERQAWLRQQSEQDWRSGEGELDRQQQQDLLNQEAGIKWQAQYANAVDNLGVNLTNEIMNIMGNGNMTAAQQQHAARQAWDRYVQMFENTTKFYSSSPLWDPSWNQTPVNLEQVYSGGGGTQGDSTQGGSSWPQADQPSVGGFSGGWGGGGFSGGWGSGGGNLYTPPDPTTSQPAPDPTYLPPPADSTMLFR